MSDAFVGLLLIIRKCMVQTAKKLLFVSDFNESLIFSIYRIPRRTLTQLEKFNISGGRKNHWPRDAIASNNNGTSPLSRPF
jgi:hypothetical protein